eukprot:TRINITY_DN1437_c0_g1_i1.p1 TRINITY_DN1437_c0_g1~~TRINITY_DN1437_c0_g1_i1.p1  ORF type:complete len:131 (+),score=24.21 TRINITY_DN1437_c0_g1_i1:58-450(+)
MSLLTRTTRALTRNGHTSIARRFGSSQSSVPATPSQTVQSEYEHGLHEEDELHDQWKLDDSHHSTGLIVTSLGIAAASLYALYKAAEYNDQPSRRPATHRTYPMQEYYNSIGVIPDGFDNPARPSTRKSQ